MMDADRTARIKEIFREQYSYIDVDDDILDEALTCYLDKEDADTICWLAADYIISQDLANEIQE